MHPGTLSQLPLGRSVIESSGVMSLTDGTVNGLSSPTKSFFVQISMNLTNALPTSPSP
jgi:hypothetical protein